MARLKPTFTQEQIITALREADGYQFRAASLIGCHQITIERAIKKWPAVAAVIKHARGERTDFTEGKLWQAIQKGEPWAIIFYLKTQAKDRGYTERIEFREIKEMSDAELVAAIEKRVGGVVRDGADGGAPPSADSPTLH